MSTVAEVRLWGSPIGAVSLEDGERFAAFQYTPQFLDSGIEVSPLMMPLRREPYVFSELNFKTFRGLPGLLADSLPDTYGTALINTWLEGQGRTPESFNDVERLCYIGTRGMGAVEFHPALGPPPSRVHDIHIDALVELASDALANREALVASLAKGHREQAMRDILSVGTSAGGARAKAVIAWNRSTNAIRSGQVDPGPGFEHWLLKFDGVENNKDQETLGDPEGYGAVELAYSEMARAAGIPMTECRLLEEHGRRHFMTKRFDRDDDGGKRHVQTLGSLAHYDFNRAGAHSYEQALLVVHNRLALPMGTVEQLYRRMAFNVIARNQDDHVKNIAFLMDRQGNWHLSPAYDVAYAFGADWTSQHQMTLNGKRDDFTLQDFRDCARVASMKRGRSDEIVGEVRAAVAGWRTYAAAAEVAEGQVEKIANTHRLDLPGTSAGRAVA